MISELFCLLLIEYIASFYVGLPLGCDADEDLEVDAWHWARKHREVLLIEKVVDCALEVEIGPSQSEVIAEADVAHIVFRKLARERDIVRRHSVSLRVEAPVIYERPFAPRQAACDS